MDEYIDKSKSGTAKARSIRAKILHHKRRFRQLKQSTNNANVSAVCTTPSRQPFIATTPHLLLTENNGISQSSNICSSSLSASQTSRIPHLFKSNFSACIYKTHQGPNQNKENRFTAPHNYNAARSSNTPLSDISSCVTNQRPTTHQSSTHKACSSTTSLPKKKTMPRAKFPNLQVNLENKFSSSTTYPIDITQQEESHINPIVADPITTSKRKQTTLLPNEIPPTQNDSSDSSDPESFNDHSEEDSSDEEGPEEHIGVNCNTPQGS
jgi:hypothetical protein